MMAKMKYAFMRPLIPVVPLYVILIIACSAGDEASDPTASIDRIDSLFVAGEIFKATRLFDKHAARLQRADSLRLAVRSASYRNNNAGCVRSVERLRDHHWADLDGTAQADLLMLQHQAHAKLFQYDRAYGTARELLEHYTTSLDTDKASDLTNEINIWKALRTTDAQRIVRKEYSEVKLAGGSNVPVRLQGSDQEIGMLFDTGANLSVLIRSVAEAMGLDLLDGHCMVKGILGNEVKAQVAVAGTLNFSNVALSNVVFLIMEDTDLYFEAADHQITGIIGYPVLAQLERIELTNDARLIIDPTPEVCDHRNLLFDHLTPIVEVVNRTDSLPFSFDTGAGETWLYSKYFEQNKGTIRSRYELSTVTVGGVGSVKEFPAYLVPFDLAVPGGIITLDRTTLFPDPISPAGSSKYYGNLGQDAIRSVRSTIVNFKDGCISMIPTEAGSDHRPRS